MELRIAVALAVLCMTGTARAGMGFGEDDYLNAVKALEGMVQDPKAAPQAMDRFCLSSVPEARPRYVPRVLSACSKILERNPKDALCTELAVRSGKKELVGIDLLSAVAGWRVDVWNWDGNDLALTLFVVLGDSRAAPQIVAAWNANIEEAVRREKRRWSSSMRAWAGWRKDAAEALGKLGGADDKGFLAEQAKATKDTYVRQACLDAIAAIDKRLAHATP
jgi:hypothetical protein